MTLPRLLSLVSAAVLFGGCSSTSSPNNVVEVRVGGTSFERGGVPAIADIPFTLTNRGSASVFVSRCDSRAMAAIDRWNGQAWVQYSADVCETVFDASALELLPGTSIQSTRSVLDPGHYRLRVGTAEASSGSFDWSTASLRFGVQ